MTQVKVGKAVVDRIMEQANVHTMQFEKVPVNQARMITSFGFCLKSFGEAAVADPKAFDKQFSDDMAQRRLLDVAAGEVWAHEGWKLMQVMNEPEQYVIPLIVDSVRHALDLFGLTCPNVEQAFWARINGNSADDLRNRLEFHTRESMDVTTISSEQATSLVWRIIEAHTSHYETLYEGITAYWKNDVLCAVLPDDWHAHYTRLILAQPLLIGDLLDDVHDYVAETSCSDKLLQGWVTAPSLRFLTLALYLSTGCDRSRMAEPNALQRSLHYIADPSAPNADHECKNSVPYAEALHRAVVDKDLFDLFGDSDVNRENPSNTNCRHSDMLLARFHEVLVDAVAFACAQLNEPERDAAIRWARIFLSGR